MATKKPTQPRAANGKFAKKQPRPISSLKPTEAIQVNNDAERDGILKLMDAEGWEWNSGETAKEVMINNSYPYALAYKFEGTDGFSNKGIRIVDLDYDGQVSFLPASDFLPTEPKAEDADQIDWTKPQAFPEGYVVPEGIRVVKIAENDEWVKKGSIGITLRPSSCPSVKWENSDYDLKGSKLDWLQPNINLAPLDPTDHPLHPEFKRAKALAKGEQNPTQPIDYKSLFHQAQSKADELQAKIEDLNETYEFDRVQRNVHREIIREKIINYAKNHPSFHSAQLLGELILDGLI